MTKTPIKFSKLPSTQMQNPAKGFLIDHTQFTDAKPPRARGESKGAGYPSFQQRNS